MPFWAWGLAAFYAGLLCSFALGLWWSERRLRRVRPGYSRPWLKASPPPPTASDLLGMVERGLITLSTTERILGQRLPDGGSGKTRASSKRSRAATGMTPLTRRVAAASSSNGLRGLAWEAEEIRQWRAERNRRTAPGSSGAGTDGRPGQPPPAAGYDLPVIDNDGVREVVFVLPAADAEITNWRVSQDGGLTVRPTHTP